VAAGDGGPGEVAALGGARSGCGLVARIADSGVLARLARSVSAKVILAAGVWTWPLAGLPASAPGLALPLLPAQAAICLCLCLSFCAEFIVLYQILVLSFKVVLVSSSTICMDAQFTQTTLIAYAPCFP
jgi:hypothetical protein